MTADMNALDAVCPTIADSLPDHPLDFVCSDDDSLPVHDTESGVTKSTTTPCMLIATDS